SFPATIGASGASVQRLLHQFKRSRTRIFRSRWIRVGRRGSIAPMARLASLPAEERLGALVTVLDHVRTHGPATRASLVDETGLTRSVVAQRVAELVDAGLVEEGALARSTGGRAPRSLRF